jgi:hypothetical protein
MGYEIDMIQSGEGGSSMVVRWGEPGSYELLVYDGGGTWDSGLLVAKHCRFDLQELHVDYVVCSNPDNSHAQGLQMLFERFSIGQFWLHRPWLDGDGPVRFEMSAAERMANLAMAYGVPIRQPFAGEQIGPFTVLSPDREWYEALKPEYERPRPLLERLRRFNPLQWTRHAFAGLAARRDYEPLPVASTIHPREEGSVVMYGELDGRGVLLTGDAGIDALTRSCDFAEQHGMDMPSNLHLLQVPGQCKPSHLSSQVLDRLVGPKLPREQRDAGTRAAFMSTPTDDRPHGFRVVTDALLRRGVKCYVEDGSQLHQSQGMRPRKLRPAKSIPERGR